MEIKLVKELKQQECDILVVNVFEGEKSSEELVNKYAIDEDKFEGKLGTTYLLQTYGQKPARKVLAVGFGKKEEFCPDKLRKAVGKAMKKAMTMEAKTVAFAFDNVDFDYSEQFVYGVRIADYVFDKYKTKKEKRVETVFVDATQEVVEKSEKVCKAMTFARDLANEPADYATPTKLAELAQGFGLEAKIFEKEQCEEMGMGAYLAVAKGSSQPPKFIHLKYSVENPKKRIALIGKGICFDSGGLDIKPPASMLTMKDDMSGAACVLGIMSVIKEFAPQVEVHGIVAACENMPGCSAYKPGDILTAKNGKTIEVEFDMTSNDNYAGTIGKIRFDPFEAEGTFAVDYIKIVLTNPEGKIKVKERAKEFTWKPGDNTPEGTTFVAQNGTMSIATNPNDENEKVFKMTATAKSRSWAYFNVYMHFVPGAKYNVKFKLYGIETATGEKYADCTMGGNFIYGGDGENVSNHTFGPGQVKYGKWIEFSKIITVSEEYIPSNKDCFQLWSNPTNNIATGYLVSDITVELVD